MRFKQGPNPVAWELHPKMKQPKPTTPKSFKAPVPRGTPPTSPTRPSRPPKP